MDMPGPDLPASGAKRAISFRLESFAEYRNQLPAERACQEVWHKARPIDYDWTLCERLDRIGVLKMFVARKDGECIGALSFFVTPSLHHGPSWIRAQHDVFYVVPEFRHGWVWFGLFRYAERELAKMGVKIIYVGDTARRPMGKIYARMGYELAETYYSKVLNEKATDEVARRSPH